jgi:hypothetical protein
MRNRRMRTKSASSRSRALATPTRTERLVLFLSYVHFLATLTATLLLVELLLSGSLLTSGRDFLSRALLPIGLLGVVNIPFLFWIRKSGVRRYHFLEHEAHLDATHLLPAEPRFHHTHLDVFGKINALIQAIESADVWDRPAARHAAKAWVSANRSRLDQEAWAYLREHLGYLLPEE